MTATTTDIDELIRNGNKVAAVVAELATTDYPMTKAGYRTAIGDAVGRAEWLQQQMAPPARSPFNVLDQAGVVGQIWPGKIMGIQNRPGPLASMLVLGALGGVSGNLTGRLMERLGGRNPVLRRNTTLLGSALGTMPGLGLGLANLSQGRSFFKNDPFGDVRRKTSQLFPVSHGSLVPVERVHDYVWNDPSLPPTIAAATAALVEGANRKSTMRNPLPIITPGDIGRMSVGLGTGYMSGVVVGKVLGGLFGVSDKSQQVLRNSGAAAGLLKAVVPMAFPGIY